MELGEVGANNNRNAVWRPNFPLRVVCHPFSVHFYFFSFSLGAIESGAAQLYTSVLAVHYTMCSLTKVRMRLSRVGTLPQRACQDGASQWRSTASHHVRHAMPLHQGWYGPRRCNQERKHPEKKQPSLWVPTFSDRSNGNAVSPLVPQPNLLGKRFQTPR